MIRFWLLRAWPALLPLALYIIWVYYRRRIAKRRGDEPLPGLLSGPWMVTLAASIIILAGCLFYLALSAEKNAGASFAPQRFEDGKLIKEQLQ